MGPNEASLLGTRPAPRSSTRKSSGFLLAAAGTSAFFLAPKGTVDLGVVTPTAAAGTAFCLIWLAAYATRKDLPWGRVLGTTVGAGMATAFLPVWRSSPGAALMMLLLAAVGLLQLWGASPFVHRDDEQLPGDEHQLHGAAVASLATWVFWISQGASTHWVDVVPVAWAAGVTWILGGHVIGGRWRSPRRRVAWACGLSVLGGCILMAVLRLHVVTVSLGVVLGVVAAFLQRSQPAGSVAADAWWEPLLGHPERLFVGTFALLSVIGATLLSLPISSADGLGLGGLDALFTSTSAVCITGLSITDVLHSLSPVGQVILLLLVQLGGLGIMTFSTAVLWALGKRMSLRHEGAVASLISTRDRGRLFATAKRVLLFTFVVEGAGAFLLSGLFWWEGDATKMALWRGVFTSVSAFCNAGFALQSDSFASYQTRPLVLHTVGLLVILGGLSPLAVLAVPRWVGRSVQPVSVQAKLCLTSAGVLLLSGFVLILGIEWQYSLEDLSFQDKIHNAWFQSVALRSAGFSSVDWTQIQPATLTLSLLLMFIGGSPGSTAGGVRTTTFVILVLSVVQTIRGRDGLEVFGKLIPEKTRARAAVIITIALGTGLLGMFAIELTQSMPIHVAVFEAVSALGTVGLTIGGTGMLDGVGKIIIIACMFVGRVGGLTLLMFLSARAFVPKVGRPEEDVDVG